MQVEVLLYGLNNSVHMYNRVSGDLVLLVQVEVLLYGLNNSVHMYNRVSGDLVLLVEVEVLLYGLNNSVQGRWRFSLTGGGRSLTVRTEQLGTHV